jgi:hypothetical protein
MKPYRGPPMTLGSAAAAKLRLMVWCKACGYRTEPDPAQQAHWYGPDTPVAEWRGAPGLLGNAAARWSSRETRRRNERQSDLFPVD